MEKYAIWIFPIIYHLIPINKEWEKVPMEMFYS